MNTVQPSRNPKLGDLPVFGVKKPRSIHHEDTKTRSSWERTHPACRGVRHPGHAGSVRSQGRNLRVLCVFAVRFFLVAAELLRVHLCSSVVSCRITSIRNPKSAIEPERFSRASV